jgi:hypothetical protein
MTGYPRDLVGYADQPPDPRWPGGARLALNFVVNYEEGGERSVLHGDKVAETRPTFSRGPLSRARAILIWSQPTNTAVVSASGVSCASSPSGR